MKTYMLPLLAVGMAATPALAAPVPVFTTSTALPSYTTAGIVESFENQSSTNGAAFVAQPNTYGYTETTTGGSFVYSATVPGVAVDTDSNTSNKFLAVESGNYQIAFNAPQQFFSFIIGSIDTYNSLTLNLTDGSSFTYNGAQIAGAATANAFATNAAGNSGVAGRVTFNFGGGAGLTSAVFASRSAALEIDDIAAAVPEAATWAMMMVGLGIAGGALRRRKATVRFVAA